MIKKVLKVVCNIITYFFFILCIVLLVILIVAKKDSDNAVNIFNHQLRIVVSDSMAKNAQTDVSQYKIKDLKIKTMILIENVPTDIDERRIWYSNLKVGDVLTFKYVYIRQETITHRISNIVEKGDGYIITLEGDNKADNAQNIKQVIDTTDTNSPNYIIGKVVYQNYLIGLMLYIIKQPIGITLIIIVPCAIIILLQIIKIINALNSQKKHKQDNEIAKLKAQIQLLEDENKKRKEDINA